MWLPAPAAARHAVSGAGAWPGAWALALMLAGGVACGSDRLLAELDGEAKARAGRAVEEPHRHPWASETQSPRPAHEGRLGLLGCTAHDAGLMGAAEAVARQQATRGPAFESSELLAILRSRGSPHVWPRLWTLEADTLTLTTIQEKWQAWLAMSPRATRLRCGVARARSRDGREIVVAVVVDALADLDPLPVRARLGQWLRLSAHLLGAASTGRVVLLGPRGTPRKVPSQVSGDALHSAFSLDQQGLWRIQVLLDTDAGPRPALEAWVFVDETPDPGAGSRPAPGETRGGPVTSASVAELRRSLLEMVNLARLSEQRLPLRRHWDLDRLAQAHAESMWRSRRTAHVLGQGSPVERLAQAGVRAFRVGKTWLMPAASSRLTVPCGIALLTGKTCWTRPLRSSAWARSRRPLAYGCASSSSITLPA